MTEIRVLTGWSNEERKELEDFKNARFNAADCINTIFRNYVNRDDTALSGKYHLTVGFNVNQLIKDIADYFTGDAKFPDKKYYVKLFKQTEGYLNFDSSNEEYILSGKLQCDGYQTQFTEEEINRVDPRYMKFAVEVEAD